MTEPASTDPEIASLLQELDAARALIVHAREDPKGGETILRAFTLSFEVNIMCQAAVMCTNETKAQFFIVQARKNLKTIQQLLKLIRYYEFYS